MDKVALSVRFSSQDSLGLLEVRHEARDCDFHYPLFAYGFLVWITVATPHHRLGTAVGWFWFALTGGLLTLGPLLASYAIPLVGPYQTLWCS